ncbi:hypothetical protein BH23CHL5_BH23CHL5_10870 [soil metagenome]
MLSRATELVGDRPSHNATTDDNGIERSAILGDCGKFSGHDVPLVAHSKQATLGGLSQIGYVEAPEAVLDC